MDVEAAERKAAEADAASSAAANLAAAAPAVLSKDWVRAFVQEMQSSADVDDAHARATRVMQAFEAAVRGAVVAEEDVADGVAMQNGSEGRKRRLARLAEENLILKRAVAIQNARQQESGELQRQILELQRACAGYQEQLQQAVSRGEEAAARSASSRATPSGSPSTSPRRGRAGGRRSSS